MARSTHVFALLALLFSASIAAADDRITEYWQRKTRESVDLLKRGEYERSLRISQHVVSDMLDRLGPGEGSMHTFGIALTHKALALAGLGRNDEALWEWHVALNLYPELVKADFSSFGEPGKFLLSSSELKKPSGMARTSGKPLTPNMTAPVVKKRYEPEYPAGARYFGVSGITIVEVVITTDGFVAQPLVLKALPAPTITYATLASLRRWRFEPGTIDGRPVNVIFNVTFNYRLR
jgi:TonB family protein